MYRLSLAIVALILSIAFPLTSESPSFGEIVMPRYLKESTLGYDAPGVFTSRFLPYYSISRLYDIR
jgi:hypothetical protein